MRSFSMPRRAAAPTLVTVQIQNLSLRSIDCSTEHFVRNGRGDTRKATKRSDRENGVATGCGAGGEGIANSSGNKIKNCCLYSLKHKAERRIMSSDTVCHLLQHSVSAWTTAIKSQQHELFGLYHGEALCLLWGRNWIFNYNLRIMKSVYRFFVETWRPRRR
jgi:hypothetical protein